MSKLAEIGASVGSRRYARDLIDAGHSTYTIPWWDAEPPLREWIGQHDGWYALGISPAMPTAEECMPAKKHLPDLELTGSNPVMSFKIKVA